MIRRAGDRQRFDPAAGLRWRRTRAPAAARPMPRLVAVAGRWRRREFPL
jgi:hypothetical protein